MNNEPVKPESVEQLLDVPDLANALESEQFRRFVGRHRRLDSAVIRIKRLALPTTNHLDRTRHRRLDSTAVPTQKTGRATCAERAFVGNPASRRSRQHHQVVEGTPVAFREIENQKRLDCRVDFGTGAMPSWRVFTSSQSTGSSNRHPS